MKLAGFTPHRGLLLGASMSNAASLKGAIVLADSPIDVRIARSTSATFLERRVVHRREPVRVRVISPPLPVRVSDDLHRLTRPEWNEFLDVAQNVHHRPDAWRRLPRQDVRGKVPDFCEQFVNERAQAKGRRLRAGRRFRHRGFRHRAAPRETGAAHPEWAGRRTKTGPRLPSTSCVTCFQLGTMKMSRGCQSTTKSGPMRVRPRPSTATNTVASVER